MREIHYDYNYEIIDEEEKKRTMSKGKLNSLT